MPPSIQLSPPAGIASGNCSTTYSGTLGRDRGAIALTVTLDGPIADGFTPSSTWSPIGTALRPSQGMGDDLPTEIVFHTEQAAEGHGYGDDRYQHIQ